MAEEEGSDGPDGSRSSSWGGSRFRVVLWTLSALIAFAGNSVLCRLALLAPEGRPASIDALSFTAVRLLRGALVLLPALLTASGGARERLRTSPLAVVALFVYAAAFSLSYVTLDAGVGALLLFGLVQITMVGAGLAAGERLGPRKVLGMLVAIAGVVLLVAPSAGDALASAPPDPTGSILMAIAGIAWGVYSLLGRGAGHPVRRTATNFLLCVPFALAALALAERSWTAEGLILAATSGAITSGLGYAIWYAALRGHTATSAAIVQLAVPVLAALGGVVWIGEAVTGRLVASSGLVLGGIAVSLAAGRSRP